MHKGKTLLLLLVAMLLLPLFAQESPPPHEQERILVLRDLLPSLDAQAGVDPSPPTAPALRAPTGWFDAVRLEPAGLPSSPGAVPPSIEWRKSFLIARQNSTYKEIRRDV